MVFHLQKDVLDPIKDRYSVFNNCTITKIEMACLSIATCKCFLNFFQRTFLYTVFYVQPNALLFYIWVFCTLCFCEVIEDYDTAITAIMNVHSAFIYIIITFI